MLAHNANTPDIGIIGISLSPGLEERLVLIRLEVDQTREQQNHVAALVHDGAVAEGAAYLAGQLVLDALVGRVVPLEAVMAVGEVDVLLVEDGGPLEGCGYAEFTVSVYSVVTVYWVHVVGCLLWDR